MPQIQLPIFPSSSTPITNELAFEEREGIVWYFNGHLPVFSHPVEDIGSFRFFISQLIANGNASQSEIARAFGVPLVSVKRACKKLREQGAAGFFQTPKPQQGHKLTGPRIEEVQGMLDAGMEVPAIGAQLGVLPNTIHKAIRAGGLKKKSVGRPIPSAVDEASSQGERSIADGEAAMGVGTTRSMERVAAALGALEQAETRFERADDVPNGGVLCALAALLGLGLLSYAQSHFSAPKGFYPMESIFLLLAYLALGRVPSLEQLRYRSPGEWGKLLGLDRIPEVKTLRDKIGVLADDPERTARWSGDLAKEWMAQDVEAAGVLLIDGHVRVYHGEATKLPRRYISRERLCLRGTTDYWVNALDGAPFFCVSKAVDAGLQKTLEEEIVPRLLADIPGQPTPEELAAEPLRHCFTLIFDREGYSPDLFKRLKTQRIAILTYHKHPGPDWAPGEFAPQMLTHPNGETSTLQLAERGTRLSNGLWVREIRSLSSSGHQTAILSTDYCGQLGRSAAAMFARWNQENFFKYMREHYGLDRLIEYGVSPLLETTRLVNPDWRSLESQVRRTAAELSRARATFAAHTLGAQESEPETAARHEEKKGAALNLIQNKQSQLDSLKNRRKATPKHVELKDFAPEQRVAQLRGGRKHFIDTIKLIAYRAETALVQLARETLRRHDDARSFLRGLFASSINLRPDPARKELCVEIHGQTNPIHDATLEVMCTELNATEVYYPGTDLRVFYRPIRSSVFPRGQDV